VRVTVVGAGVIGLVTARVLEERGYAVRVIATATGDRTTSAVAGAVWFPYRCGPPERVTVWGLRTREWLTTLALVPETGVDLLTGYEISATDELPYWAAGFEVARVAAPVTGAPLAWRFHTMRVEPARFLPWLERGLKHPIERRPVIDLAAEPGDVVVDCTGLAARELTGDLALLPLLGQIVITETGGCDPAVTITDDRDPDAIFYVIPRRAELVLGGSSLPWPPGAPPAIDPATTQRILDHARTLGLPIGKVLDERVGLRPFRPAVRLERDPRVSRVIHNYGHGGAGFTLCMGCAEAVAALVAATS
jgi:D-amino-acid oxidase